MDYQEFGTIEIITSEKMYIRSIKEPGTHQGQTVTDILKSPGALDPFPTEVVLFDKEGNFIGQISEIVDTTQGKFYVINNQDIGYWFKCHVASLKPQDMVYYYDRNFHQVTSPRTGSMNEEFMEESFPNFNLNQSKVKRRMKNKEQGQIGKTIFKNMLNSLRNLRIDNASQQGEKMGMDLSTDQLSNLANRSTSMANPSNSQHRTSFNMIREIIKKKRYKKYKSRILQNFQNMSPKPSEPILQGQSSLRDFSPGTINKKRNRIENELCLGKRNDLEDSYPNLSHRSRNKRRRERIKIKNEANSSGSSRFSHLSQPPTQMNLIHGQRSSEPRRKEDPQMNLEEETNNSNDFKRPLFGLNASSGLSNSRNNNDSR